MKKYPILTFDVIVEENEYNTLKHLKNCQLSDVPLRV